MGRREQREQLFKLLFRLEFNSAEDMPEQKQLFFDDSENKISATATELISVKYDSILEKLSDIDKAINDKAEGWSTDRMGKVDLTLLRIAVYEILYDEEVPTGVAINEAVELAKKFGQDNSYGFVNGILGKFA